MNASIPQHIYGYVENQFMFGGDEAVTGLHPCVIFGVTSIPSRTLHFSILCESGAQWARVPLHFLRHEEPSNDTKHALQELQCWDCHGWDFSVTQYEYLREMSCTFKNRSGKIIPATYWFTLDHTDNGYSNYPPEHKCYHLLRLDDGSGQIAAMPNNRIVWQDFSFVKEFPLPKYKVVSAETYHAEESTVNAQDTANTQEAKSFEETKLYDKQYFYDKQDKKWVKI
jgi:hypothetical protein